MELSKILESTSYIRKLIKEEPEIGIILGSGLGDMAEDIEEKIAIKYSDIPNFPESTVKGHAGQFVIGRFQGKIVIMMQGRFHYYEGNEMELLALPVYVMKHLGIKTLIVTNAAGGVNTGFTPGDLMIITDHVNFAFNNPLIGRNYDEIGPRFPDMSNAYDKDLVELASSTSKELNIDLRKGVYFMVSGPSYETPAEVKMIRILGGDAVGMSTVPEVIAAKHCGLKVLGVSCITNMASGILNQPLDHKEVIETSIKVKSKFINLISSIVKKMK